MFSLTINEKKVNINKRELNMERIIITSDSHGRSDILKIIYEYESKRFDNTKGEIVFLSCGDNCVNKEEIYPYISVKGNMDFFYYYPSFLIIPVLKHKIYMTHGNNQSLYTLLYAMDEKNCDILITGHTHILKIDIQDNRYFLNPGSVSRPRGNDRRSYLILDIDNEGIIKITKKGVEEIL